MHLESIAPTAVQSGLTGNAEGTAGAQSMVPFWNVDSNKVVVRMTDMSDSMQSFAIETAKEARRRVADGMHEVAKKVKLEFDKTYQGNWHCIVGTDFGSFITHETNSVIFFYIGRDAFLVWKTR